MNPIYVSLLSLQDIYWLMTYAPIRLISCAQCPPNCLLNCDHFTCKPAQLWPFHPPTRPASLLSCDLFMHQPAWLLTCGLSKNLDAQLWPVHLPRWAVLTAHQPGCTVVLSVAQTCPLSCHLSTSLPGSVVTHPPAWLRSCDMFISVAAHLWPVNQPGCSVMTCQPTWLHSCGMSTGQAAQL